MGKKLLATAIVLATSIASYNAMSATYGKAYLGASYGVGIPNKLSYVDDVPPTRPKNSQVFGLALGYNYNDNIRIEMAFNNFNFKNYKAHMCPGSANECNDIEYEHYTQKSVSSNAFLANLYFDIKKYNKLSPYVTAGLGIAKNKSSDLIVTEKEKNSPEMVTVAGKARAQNKFAWNIGAGISYEINERVTLNLISYKYYNLGEISTKNTVEEEYIDEKLKAHNVSAGIRIKI